MNQELGLGIKLAVSTNAMMPYRHQILQQLLENKAGLCIDSIASQLIISRAAVQQHFKVLEKDGLIKKHDQLKTNGRPVTRYVLTDAGIDYFPKHYFGFSSLLMQELKDEMGSEKLEAYLGKLGSKLAKTYRPRFEGKPEIEQITILVELMQHMGFHANITQNTEDQDTEIHAYNCIYHHVAQQFKEICAFDMAFIRELLADIDNKQIKLHTCMAKGDGICCFKLASNVQ
jgi:predicted ArsR family transcriptional regulator